MEVSGQLHASAALPPAPTELEAGFCGGEKNLALPLTCMKQKLCCGVRTRRWRGRRRNGSALDGGNSSNSSSSSSCCSSIFVVGVAIKRHST
jgi:hypothetical protein